MLNKTRDSAIFNYAAGKAENIAKAISHQETLLKTVAQQSAVLNSTNFSSIVTDEKGVIHILNIGVERMLGYEIIARAKALSVELSTPIAPNFKALAFNAPRSIEDIYELACFRKDGSRFMAIVSVTTLRDALNAIVGYLLIGTYHTVRKNFNKALPKPEAQIGYDFSTAPISRQ